MRFFPHLFTCCCIRSPFCSIARSRGCILSFMYASLLLAFYFHSQTLLSLLHIFLFHSNFEHRQLVSSYSSAAAKIWFCSALKNDSEQSVRSANMAIILCYCTWNPRRNRREFRKKRTKRHKSYSIELLFIVCAHWNAFLRHTCSFFNRVHFNHFIWTVHFSSSPCTGYFAIWLLLFCCCCCCLCTATSFLNSINYSGFCIFCSFRFLWIIIEINTRNKFHQMLLQRHKKLTTGKFRFYFISSRVKANQANPPIAL